MSDGAGIVGSNRGHAAHPSRGGSQSGVRLYNERLVLSLIRAHRSLPKAEIARLTGLSAQTISVIIRQLEGDRLLVRERPIRGRIGQPSIPLALDPEGAFSLGLKLGRRSAEMVLMDLVGRVRARAHEDYPFPTPTALEAFVVRGQAEVTAGLSPIQAARVCGLGIAAPFELWGWGEELGVPSGALAGWRGYDIGVEVARRCRVAVHPCNDATAACAAELAFGRPHPPPDFLHLFIATFVGGGVVLDGSLHPGRRSNAGALASMPVPPPAGSAGAPPRLVRFASLYLLERMLRDEGCDPTALWHGPGAWRAALPVIERWLEPACAALASAILGAVAVLDVPTVIIDGAFPPWVRQRIVERVRGRLATEDRQGLEPFEVVEGSIGGDARVIGAAALPLLASFWNDREVMLKEPEPPPRRPLAAA